MDKELRDVVIELEWMNRHLERIESALSPFVKTVCDGSTPHEIIMTKQEAIDFVTKHRHDDNDYGVERCPVLTTDDREQCTGNYHVDI